MAVGVARVLLGLPQLRGAAAGDCNSQRAFELTRAAERSAPNQESVLADLE